MSEERDLYKLLEVEPDADRDSIRKAYRKLARKNHPDLNPGDSLAEERFKHVAKAWAILSDEKKRRDYDEFGELSLEAGFDAEEARKVREKFGSRFGYGGHSGAGHDGMPRDEFHFSGIDDLLGQMFAQGAGSEEQGIRFRGADLEASLELDFIDAVQGGEKKITLGRPGKGGLAVPETVKVRIPPGVTENGRLKIPGKGAPGMGGGPSGDLQVSLRIRPHPVFGRDKRHLTLDLPITVREATLGTDIEVPTQTGRATVTIPVGTDGGTRLRLRGQGVPGVGSDPPGDLLVRVQIEVPKDLDAEATAAINSLSKFEPPEIREELFK